MSAGLCLVCRASLEGKARTHVAMIHCDASGVDHGEDAFAVCEGCARLLDDAIGWLRAVVARAREGGR